MYRTVTLEGEKMKRVVVPEIRKENIIRKFFREIQNRKNIQIYKISLVHFWLLLLGKGKKKVKMKYHVSETESVVKSKKSTNCNIIRLSMFVPLFPLIFLFVKLF